MFTRYASAISSSTIMTLGLIYIMQTLISIQPGVIVDKPTSIAVDWRRIPEPPEPPITRDERIKKDDLIDTITPPETKIEYASTDKFTVGIPTQKAPRGKLPTHFGQGDGPLVTLFNVQPIYPVRALQRGIEGYVIVEFDVDRAGRVVNVRILETSNQIFNRAATNAAERIKFKARVVDGTAVATSNVQKLFRFDIEEE